MYWLPLNLSYSILQTLIQLKSGALKGTKVLKLSEQLDCFPLEIFDLAETLEYLDLSSNRLSELPVDFGRLSKLKIFFASDNLFTRLPKVLGDCPLLDIVGFKSNQIETIHTSALNVNLRWLILTNNKIKEIPDAIGKCLRLQKLMLAGNLITNLPESLSNCTQLGLLRISANKLSHLPKWLICMPSLAWLAYSGNAIQSGTIDNYVVEIDPLSIQLDSLIGEGASGTIYKGVQNLDGVTTDVAVKLFKGDVTSDGYPEDEMKAFIASGKHDSIVGLLGRVNFNEDGKKAVVMELIPDQFYNLGRPPSLESCTRDIFDVDQHLSLKQLFNVAQSIASVGDHLHKIGIVHGDLYAHNILVDADGKTLFGDFGAASFYNINNAEEAKHLQKIEVKAYGYLLDDLLSICKTDDFETAAHIRKLSIRCLSTDIEQRPNFEEITKYLINLKLNLPLLL